MGLFNAVKYLAEEFKAANEIAGHLNDATQYECIARIANEKIAVVEEKYGRNSSEAKAERELNSRIAESAVSSADSHRQQAAILRKSDS